MVRSGWAAVPTAESDPSGATTSVRLEPVAGAGPAEGRRPRRCAGGQEEEGGQGGYAWCSHLIPVFAIELTKNR